MTTMPDMSILRTVVLTSGGIVLAAAAVAGAVVWSGIYPVAATRAHFQFVYSILENTMRHSVQLSARDVQVPDLSGPAWVERGASCYRDHCVQCHGAPGVAQGMIGRGMQPLPGPLVDAHLRWQPREIYWITRNGIRMSGMPAWEFRLADDDLWALTAFVDRLPQLSPSAYRAMVSAPGPGGSGADAPAAASCTPTPAQRDAAPQRPPDPERGRTALSQYACSACHTIPGVTSSSPQVGPPLAGLAQRSLIAGKLNNTTPNMVLWLRHPQRVDPLTAMPDLQVSETDARDMAAYLSTLR